MRCREPGEKIRCAVDKNFARFSRRGFLVVGACQCLRAGSLPSPVPSFRESRGSWEILAKSRLHLMKICCIKRSPRKLVEFCPGQVMSFWSHIRQELRPTINLAVPLVLAELGWMTMGIVDTVMVGHLP